MSKRGIILQGSSRSDGNTNKIVSFIKERTGFDSIDLLSKNISAFDYDKKNENDDYAPLMEDLVKHYDLIVFATPIYWYAMSGIMKNFFDRLVDVLKDEKKAGEKLKGMSMAMVSCGSGAEIKDGFTMPFVESANYLGMHYLGDIHTWLEDDEITMQMQKDLTAFSEMLIKE